MLSESSPLTAMENFLLVCNRDQQQVSPHEVCQAYQAWNKLDGRMQRIDQLRTLVEGQLRIRHIVDDSLHLWGSMGSDP